MVYTGGDVRAGSEVICGDLEGAGKHFSWPAISFWKGPQSPCLHISHVKESQNLNFHANSSRS